MPKYTVESGRTIVRDGIPLAYVALVQDPETQARNITPHEADQLTHRMVRLLNTKANRTHRGDA